MRLLTSLRRTNTGTAPTEVTDVALSFVWAQTVPGLFDGLAGPAARLASRPRYRRIFGRTEEGPQDVDRAFAFPWPYFAGQHFWMHYLGVPSLEYVDGDVAWTHLVPLRERLSNITIADEAGPTWITEAFYFPHGIGLVVALRLRAPRTVEATVRELQRLTRDVDLRLTVDNAPFRGRLRPLATSLMGNLMRSRYGPTAAAAPWRADPFTICTIVQASAIDPKRKLRAAGDVHRGLHALAGWSPSWADDPVGKVEDSALVRASKPAGHVVYMADRGRVVWFPSHFATTNSKRHSLTCYHRNLTFTSLLIESLTSLLADALPRIQPPGRLLDLSKDHREALANATARLSDLYLGRSTYRTGSAPPHITANGGKDLVNGLGGQFGVASLP